MLLLAFGWTCQGSLDLKYLSDRYKKGVNKVEEYMQSSQRYIMVRSLDDGVPDLMQQIQVSVPTPWLSNML